MGSIVVCGGSIIGLSVAAMLAADGHQVTVLESDPATVGGAPKDAWHTWQRSGVAQFRQPHNAFARFRHVCDEELPGLTERLLAAGCTWVDYLDTPPPTIEDFRPQPGDEAVRFVTGRRPVVESVIAGYALDQPGVHLRRGVRVAELIEGRSVIAGTPHVTGVRTTTGEEVYADLVVDATGRRSPAERWLAELGARSPIVEAADRGFVYYTRYFTGPDMPRRLGRALAPIGSISILTLSADNDTWSVTVFGMTGDAPLKSMRETATFDRVVAACPLQAHWLDGKPLSDVVCMAGILDRYRRFVVDGTPVVTGFVATGDAWACTNPSAGRGLSSGIVHAQVLRRMVRKHLDRPADFALAMDEETEQGVTPFYRAQVAADRVRVEEMAADREGRPAERMLSDMDRLTTAAGQDAAAFRGLIEIINCMTFPPQVLSRPEVARAVAKVGDTPPPPTPGPSRAQLLQLLAG